LFEDGDFSQAADVPFFTRKLRAEEGLDTIVRGFDANHARAEYENIHIVMFDALVGGVMVVTESRADTFDLVGGDTRADTAAADENRAFGLVCEESVSDFGGEIGVVDGGGGVGPDIDNLVAFGLEALADVLFQFVPCVVTTYDNEHE
jgi:hypothetical protein